MKKIFIALLCVVIVCATPFAVFAEGEDSSVQEATVTTTEEIATEGENEATEGVSTEAAAVEKTTVAETTTEKSTGAFTVPTTEDIIRWAEDNLKDVIVIVTILASLIYQLRKHASLNKSVATCNNNAVAVVENSNAAIANALSEVAKVSTAVEAYKVEIDSLLGEIRLSDAEKKKLEATLADYEKYLETAKLANLELSNEIAELIVLSNIPNSKKEEFFSRHRAAVAAIDAVVGVIDAVDNTEVKHDGEKA